MWEQNEDGKVYVSDYQMRQYFVTRERAIVVHGAAYANPSVCKSGRLGRSFGCTALPQALTNPIINTIKGGSVLFIYANNKEYICLLYTSRCV